MTTNLLATKLHLPTLVSKRVQRLHLIRLLAEGLATGRRLTLVSAPAGFGKTTCVSEWASQLKIPVSWLSLDALDDDPARFFAYFIAALQKVDESLGLEIENALRSGQIPPVEIISTTLTNDILEAERPFVIVLDDFHVIQDSTILQVLERLLTNLPGSSFHLALITREDPALPLARLRANNQMTEIRAGDLRFNEVEADRFLNELMGLSLSQDNIAALEDKTEGWIAGLQLAGLSLRDRVDPSGFIAALSGSHRHILSYLTEEVLSQQTEDTQQFLLQTSVLERLNGDLCNAVTGRKDSHTLLEQLSKANLFLIPLDDEQQWYRYHQLFADLLRDRQKALQSEKVTTLHQRASQWYAQAGMASEAIQHAMAAKDYAAAVHLLEDHAIEMTIQGHAKAMDGWTQALPPEWRIQSPKINLAFAWSYIMRGHFTQAAPYIAQLQAIFSTPAAGEDFPASLKAEWLALQSMLLSVQGKPVESVALANQALDIVPEEDGYVRSLIYMGLASAYQQVDDYARAVDAYQMIIKHSKATNNFTSEMLGLSGLAQLALNHDQLHFGFDVASQGIELAERTGIQTPISAAVYGSVGEVYFQWYQIEKVQPYFQRSIQLAHLSGYSDAEVGYGILRSSLLQIEGDLEGAAREIQKAFELMQAMPSIWVKEQVIAQQVRVALAQDRLAAAEAALKQSGILSQDKFTIPELAPGQALTRPAGLLYNSALRILLYRAQTKRELAGLKPGLELAEHLIASALQRQYVQVAIETLLIRAQMHAALGDNPACLEDIARAVELAEPEGFITLFLAEGQPIAEALAAVLEHKQFGNVRAEYIKDILAAFSRLRQASVSSHGKPTLIAPLTEREVDVLRLMSEGLKYEEIAEKLFVSLNTVRSHVKAIYGKLNADNRTKAIEIARQLQII